MTADLVARLLAETEEAMSRVYFDGWCNAARWAERGDLVSDEGSHAYARDRDPCIEAAIAKVREAASALRSSGEVTPPDANWCRTCGKHRNDPMAIFCNDRCHDKLHKTGITPPTSTNARRVCNRNCDCVGPCKAGLED